jgi:hypothetical protein
MKMKSRCRLATLARMRKLLETVTLRWTLHTREARLGLLECEDASFKSHPAWYEAVKFRKVAVQGYSLTSFTRLM